MPLVEIVAPARLGRSFRWLLAATWTSCLADGISLAAGPLLVASLTRSTSLIALAATLQWLPPLVLSLLAGVVTDRRDRRAIVVTTGLIRCVVLLALLSTVVTDTVRVWMVLVALLAFAAADTFAGNAANTLLPAVVDRDDLALANARTQAGFTLGQLAGPPIGAALFAVSRELPYLGEFVLVVGAIVLILRIRVRPPSSPSTGGLRAVRSELAEGIRWTRRHPAVRTLVLTIFTFNITFGAAWSVLVVYAHERLGFGAVGYGLITTAQAAGGLAGTVAYGRIVRHVSLGNIMRVGLIIETLTHLALALTTVGWLALIVFAVFGAHAFVWGTTSVTVRQRAVPDPLRGRVGSVNAVASYGGLVIGSGIGGTVASAWSVTAPFWFAFGGSAVFVVAIWRQLTHIAHEQPLAT